MRVDVNISEGSEMLEVLLILKREVINEGMLLLWR